MLHDQHVMCERCNPQVSYACDCMISTSNLGLNCIFVFFFFKQKTAYEMRISDWSSDVCSSDLRPCVPGWRERSFAAGGSARSSAYPGVGDSHPAGAGGPENIPLSASGQMLRDRKSTRLNSSH